MIQHCFFYTTTVENNFIDRHDLFLQKKNDNIVVLLVNFVKNNLGAS